MKSVPSRIEIPEKDRPIKWGAFLKVLTILLMCFTPVLVVVIFNFLFPVPLDRWLSFAKAYPTLEAALFTLGIAIIFVYSGYAFYVKDRYTYLWDIWPFGFFKQYDIRNNCGRVMMLCFVDEKLQTIFFDDEGRARSYVVRNDYKKNTIIALYNLSKGTLNFYLLRDTGNKNATMMLNTYTSSWQVDIDVRIDLDGDMDPELKITYQDSSNNVDTFYVHLRDLFDHIEEVFHKRYNNKGDESHQNFAADFALNIGHLRSTMLFSTLQDTKTQLVERDKSIQCTQKTIDETCDNIAEMLKHCERFELSRTSLEARELSVKLWKLLLKLKGTSKIQHGHQERLKLLTECYDDPKRQDEFKKPIGGM